MLDSQEAKAILDDFARRLTKDKTRFAVGRKGAGCSAVWAAWEQGSEFYIGAASFLGSTKISLHKSTICRLALTERHYHELPKQGLKQPPDRALTKWRRPPTPEFGAVHVLSLIFPTDYLRLDDPKSSVKKPVMIIEPPPSGYAAQVGFFYSRQTGEPMEEKFLKVGYPLFYFDLRNGDTVWMVVKQIPFDRSALPEIHALPINPDNVLDRKALLEPGAKIENLTAHFWNSPKDGESFFLWELGGVSMHGP